MTNGELIDRLLKLNRPTGQALVEITEPYDDDAQTLVEPIQSLRIDEKTGNIILSAVSHFTTH
jgi:hypothetical protein